MHQRETFELLNKIVLLIFFTSKLSSSLEIVTTNKVVAKPGEDAQLVCEADSIVDECSWFAPENTPDKNRKDKMLEIQLKIDFMIGVCSGVAMEGQAVLMITLKDAESLPKLKWLEIPAK